MPVHRNVIPYSQMRKRLHILYIPGLGDKRARGQRLAVMLWRLWGVEAEVYRMYWADQETWASKYERLLRRIDALSAQGKTVGLVGSSAGASAVINAFEVRTASVAGCVLICGKVQYPHTIGERVRKEDPAFILSAEQCSAALGKLGTAERTRILSLYATSDHIVPERDSHIEGARNRRVLTSGHAFTIGTQLLFGAHNIFHFLNSCSDTKVLEKMPVTPLQ